MEDSSLNIYIQWDVKNWSKAIEYWMIQVEGKKKLKVLELGCGPGGISLLFDRIGFEVVCSDYQGVQDEVKEFHKKHGARNISYADIDAVKFNLREEYDVIVFKSVLGGASRYGKDENKTIVLNNIFNALKHDGILLFSENLKSTYFHALMRSLFTKWGAWNYCSIEDFNEGLRKFRDVEMFTTGFLGTFGRNESQRRFLSLFDEAIFNHLVPSNWQYIIYGSARKP